MDDTLLTIKKRLKNSRTKRIVFPEATDERILMAVTKLTKEKLIFPIFIGDEKEILSKMKELRVRIENYEVIHPLKYNVDKMVETFVQLRKGKVSTAQARFLLKDDHYFATMLVHQHIGDGLVSGATHITSDSVRPALQIIKTKEGVNKTSGIAMMVRGEERFLLTDCAINIAPTSRDLAEIAMESAKTARLFHIEPRIAMLSFSTKGSANSLETKRVSEAVRIVKKRKPSLIIDGELQFDTAFVPTVAEKKAPGSAIKGDATVLVFPSLEAGNIGFKIMERLGGFTSIGPILQGLRKPVNLLSRGCSVEDVYHVALITAAQVEE